MSGKEGSSEQSAPGRSKRKRAAETVTLVACILQAVYWGIKLTGVL
ncbi:hypothetical protein ACIRIR_35600 [Streptomyces globisporus]|nr:hypothetical protein [Streptomyces sp. YIM 132580]MXG30363.1 hypothetical protein [Streptomyces sp. YIM 132580]